MRTVKTKTIEALEAFYAKAFDAPDPFTNKMGWIMVAIELGFLDSTTHPRSYSNCLKEMELTAPTTRSHGVARKRDQRHVYREADDVYVFFAKSPFEVSGNDVREMKKCYAEKPHGLGYTVNQVCKHFTLGRRDFMFIKTELGWTHDQDEFTDEEHTTRAVEDLLDDRAERSRWLLEQAHKDQRQKDVEAKAKAWEAWEEAEKAADRSAPLEVALIASEPNGLRVAVLMLADLHIGEGGSDEARSIMSRCVQALTKAYAEADRVVFCLGGDFFHADTYNGTTTKGTYVSTMPPEEAVTLAYSFLDGLLRHTDKDRTTYLVVAGNHDRIATSHMVQWMVSKGYCLNASPYEVAAAKVGKSLVFGFVHGDLHRGKHEAILMEMIESGQWQASRPFRAVYMGHKHHKRTARFTPHQIDVQGTLFKQVASPNGHRGQYERQQGYQSNNHLTLDIWSDTKGLVAEFTF